jgi:hypothetical protein
MSGARLARRSVLASAGALFRATLSEAARLQVTIAQRVSGRRVRGRCRAAARTGRRCSVLVVRRRLSLSARSGPNAVPVRLAGLKPGSYRLTIEPRDAAGNRGPAQSLALTVRRPPKRR